MKTRQHLLGSIPSEGVRVCLKKPVSHHPDGADGRACHNESSVARCASCHANIDPPGVALESFDVMGGVRATYRKLKPNHSEIPISYLPEAPPRLRYQLGLAVECADTLESGESFKDIQEYKNLLLRDRDQLARNFIQQFLVYSTGARLSFADRELVEQLVASTRESGHGCRSLIHAVVSSPLFAIR